MSTDPKINRELGEKIRTVRKARGYTREALAERIDVNRGRQGRRVLNNSKENLPCARSFRGLSLGSGGRT